MDNVRQHIDFVKQQIAHYDDMARKSRQDPKRLDIYISVAKNLRLLLVDLEEYANGKRVAGLASMPLANSLEPGVLAKLPAGFLSNPLVLSPSDMVGLPEDVMKELNISPSDKLEIAIIDLVNALGGTTILDKIISGLYHTTGEIYQRNIMTAKLYRMSRKGHIFSVPKKKGIYTTTRPEGMTEEEDIQSLT